MLHDERHRTIRTLGTGQVNSRQKVFVLVKGEIPETTPTTIIQGCSGPGHCQAQPFPEGIFAGPGARPGFR